MILPCSDIQTQIEFYDKDVIKNILAVLTAAPEKVIYIYDRQLDDMSRFEGLKKCFRRHFPNIQMETYPVDVSRIGEIYTVLCRVIKQNKGCALDLTGGSELMTIAGYRAGLDQNIRLIYTDIIKEEMVDIFDENHKVPTATLTLQDFVDAHGAEVIGSSHDEPEEREYARILSMCRTIFTHLSAWKSTCTFFQVALADSAPAELDLRIRTEIQQKDGRMVKADEDLLYEFQRQGFIRDLYYSGKHLVLTICSKKYKTYLISFGVWLELYVFIHAKMCGCFQDVKLGAMIDWDAYDGIVVAGNEIDVIAQDRNMPVFVSCKLRSADTPALNELIVAKKRLGGWFSKGIIVTFGDEKSQKNGTYRRAKELGIELLDRSDVLSQNFGERLERAVRGHDLVSLKWKRI